jgi:uncharacterized OsmC-like protein
VGRGTAVTRVQLKDNLACDIRDGDWSLVAGMTEKYGGTNGGPNPGVLGRAALGSCLAIGYGIWAARLGVPLTSADYDVSGELAVNDAVRPGYGAMRYIVRVVSAAPEEDVRRVIDTADRYSSWRDVIANEMPLERELTIAQPAAADAPPS